MTATAPATVTVSTAALSEVIYNAYAGQKMTVVYDSKASSFMNKGRGENANPYYAHVVKRTTARGRFAGSRTYKSGVDSARAKEGHSEPMEVKNHLFGEHVDHTAVLENRNNGNLYLCYTIKDSDPTEYATSVFIDTRTGAEVDRATLAPWLKAKSASKPATQELDEDEVFFRNPAMDGILSLSYRDKLYKVSNRKPMTIAALRTRLGQASTASN